MTRTKMTTLALLFASGSAFAAPAAPPLPKEVKDMDCLVGRWAGTGTMAMGGAKVKVKVTWDCQRSSGGHGVLCKARMTGIPGMASYEETDLFGFEPGTKKYHWFSVTNGGETHDHVADLPAGNTIDFVHTGTQDGKPFKETVALTFSEDSKSLTFRGETLLDGKSTSLFEAKATKK
jgi:hypothetical protein